jgi:hypothetical protein
VNSNLIPVTGIDRLEIYVMARLLFMVLMQ